MNTELDRQRARDRAADAFVPRDRVICGADGWTPPLLDPMLSQQERYRRRAALRRRRTR